ncbi:MAG: hypothetical protein GEU78_15465 [Actinobacteria bacterium]|nr:hypothetical protein [Actinomycetota bacterium]
MVHRIGPSRGDRRRNARKARLRSLLPREYAIVGVDLADEKQVFAVCDHDGQVVGRRSVNKRECQLHLAPPCQLDLAPPGTWSLAPPSRCVIGGWCWWCRVGAFLVGTPVLVRSVLPVLRVQGPFGVVDGQGLGGAGVWVGSGVAVSA